MGKQPNLFPDELDQFGALSALVKAIRLRKPLDALIWLHLLSQAWQNTRFRAQRRVLIGAAEDCMSIPVMRAVSDWYNSPSRHNLHAASREVLRIIKSPNWYATDRGRAYIRRWREVELLPNPFRREAPDSLFQILEDAIRSGASIQAMHAFFAINEKKDWNRQTLAHLLNRFALEFANTSACALAELFNTNCRSLWNDTNYSGLALDALLGGPLDEDTNPIIAESELVQLIANTRHSLSQGVTIPEWARDGIHCSGKDPRFSGLWEYMAASCNAYEHYGRLDPEDVWSPEFFEPKHV